MIGFRWSSVLAILASSTMALGGPAPGAAQSLDARTGDTQTGDVLVVYGPDDTYLSFPVGRLRGYATVSHRALDQLGWAVEVDPTRLRAQLGLDGPVVEFSLGSPLFRWDDELLQMVSPPFSGGGSIQIPLQFVVDFLPARAGEAYAFSPDQRTLEILDASRLRALEPALRGVAALLSPETGIVDALALALSYAAEAGLFQQAGFSAVICGPGSIDQAHRANEFIELAQVEACEVVLRRLIDWAARGR